ncbi:MAG: hypothetical protein K8L99_20110 [Anaerolineae bacterium]|nr:hypothetical protein [Anaerolineae bacterium]
MAKIKLAPELIEGILERVPEGFIHRSTLNKRVRVYNKDARKTLITSKVGQVNDIFFDSTRLTQDQVEVAGKWFHPSFPSMSKNGVLLDKPIVERIQERNASLVENGLEDALPLLKALDETQGCALVDEVERDAQVDELLPRLLKQNFLKKQGDFVYDPLRVSDSTMGEIRRQHSLMAAQQDLIDYLRAKPGQTAPQTELAEKFGITELNEMLSLGGVVQYSVRMKVEPYRALWIRPKNSDAQAAQKVAAEAVRIKDEDWQPVLEASGTLLRPGARDGSTHRAQVVARSYTLSRAAKRLNIKQVTLDRAIEAGWLSTFMDPEERVRIPAHEIEAAATDPELSEQVLGYETVRARDVALVSNTNFATLRRRLKRLGVSPSEPLWGEVRGKWNLPTQLWEFEEAVRNKKAEIQAERDARLAEEQRLLEEMHAQERQRREELRSRLVAAFPTWRHEDRVEQRVVLHVGPPNSGKTHDALQALASAGSGWYLAPLRLLAFEIFDRLNRDGILCNLLTGEEYIPVPGATITAATIEMFNPFNSGDCVIIDEAQMLADPDRGWAWTRALMEAQAPEIHVIGPLTAQELIQKMADAAAIQMEVVEHERLAPIKVADESWPLQNLEPRTILVAFSRQMVLELKVTLEGMKRRVSVVYGNLPPEVRRKQADRFADGETEICIATDAVGMGLNLPADYVCFYEVQKYDGRNIRDLTANEVQQIGGRAGRYGLSKTGEIGATNERDLRLVRKLYHEEPTKLTHARVAPSVEDLEMIPGNLAEKLVQWASLESIPESLRGAIKTADMSERIELARMLTDAQVEQLGLATALKLINAPTRQSSRSFWLDCAHGILSEEPMPVPPEAPKNIATSHDLENIETAVTCADIYLWLARRREFNAFAANEDDVRERRGYWSSRIDIALMHNITTVRRCSRCKRPLPARYRYGLCQNCYTERFQRYRNW